MCVHTHTFTVVSLIIFSSFSVQISPQWAKRLDFPFLFVGMGGTGPP